MKVKPHFFCGLLCAGEHYSFYLLLFNNKQSSRRDDYLVEVCHVAFVVVVFVGGRVAE